MAKPDDQSTDDRDDRRKNGQFKNGNKGGPGRPRGGSKQISEVELRRIATPLVPTNMFMLVRQFDELNETLNIIMLSDTHSPEAKKMLRVEIENQRLASILLNQRLRTEIRNL